MSILNTFTISRADLAKHKKGYRGFQQSNSVRKLPSLKRTVSSTKSQASLAIAMQNFVTAALQCLCTGVKSCEFAVLGDLCSSAAVL